MLARNKDDGHRAATELELLFDLVFVIAIALTSVGLHHAIAEAHYADGLIKFMFAFFFLWWPWMHFTWFASAFDNDDAVYRVSVMVMMFGVLLIAGSLPEFFKSFDVRLMSIGYVVLRIPYIFLWFRVGNHNPKYKTTSQRYVWGQLLLQCFWLTIAFIIPMDSAIFFVFATLGLIAELLVPYYANKVELMPFHRHHIIERFGLLNIIVLGEVLLSAALAIQAMNKSGHWTAELVFIAISATIVPFALWWIYFNEDENLHSDKAQEMSYVFIWGYAHFFIFASAAAIGSGFAALVDASGDHGHGNPKSALWVISLSVAIYIFTVWMIRDRHILEQRSSVLLLVFAALIAITPLLPLLELPVLTLLLIVALTLRLNVPVQKITDQSVS